MNSEYRHILLLVSALALVWPVRPAVPEDLSDATSTGARASLLKHWHNVLPTTEIPALLLSKSSPLTASQVDTFSSYMDSHTLNTPAHLFAFCSAAKILCSDNLPLQGASNLEGVLPNHQSGYEQTYQTGRDIPNSIDSPEPLKRGIFFREANLTAGYKIHIPDIRDKRPTTYFLPKRLSDKLPFSSKSLASLVELLGVSSLQGTMSTTVTICELAPMSGELKSCVRSIEDMANLVEAALGKKAEALVMQSTDGWGQDATVAAAVAMNGGKVTATVACHRMMFPYMVYYCHMLPGVKVYNVELLIGDGAVKKKNRLVAICHMETSDWSPNHVAFKLLGSGPGKTEACHFFYESAIPWVAQEEPMSAWPIK